MNRFKPQESDSINSNFLKTLALRGLQPDHRANSSKFRTNTTDMATHFPGPSQPDHCQPDSDAYRCYLHKLPHVDFTLINDPPATLCCIACDDTAPIELHQCTKCGLTLCGVCVYVITDRLIRGDLRRLIEHVARWKVGYSLAFLEREKAEAAREWEEYGKIKAEAESRRVQEYMDCLFEKMMENFTVEGKRRHGSS